MTFASLFHIIRKNLVIATSLLVFTACLGVFFVRNGQIRRLEAEFDDLNINHARMLKNFKYSSGLEEDLAESKRMIEDVNTRLFHAEDLAGNQRYFYKIESATGVKLQNLQQIAAATTNAKRDKNEAKKAAKSKYQEIAYEMNVTGSYERTLAFLRHLEGGSAFYKLEGLSVAQVRVGPTDTAIGMRVGLQILGSK